MNAIAEAALEFQDLAREEGWSHAFVGGLAVGAWGEPRTTRDFDVCVFSDFGSEGPVIDRILGEFAPRIPDSADFALRSRVLLIKATNGTPGDISLGALPFEEQMLARASLVECMPGCVLRVISAEDLVVMKAFARRDRDIADLAGIFARQGAKLDVAHARRWLGELLELSGRSEEAAWFDHFFARQCRGIRG